MNFNNLNIDFITKDNIRYNEEIECFNRAIVKFPKVILKCKSVEDVKEALLWVKDNNLEFRIRSGRHHYEGYSTGDNIVIIDLKEFNNIYVDEEKEIVTIDGGVRNRELYEAVNGLGYPFPGGGCPTVGVSGFTLGGGWGYSSRMFGLGCDNLISLEMVNCNGEVIVADKDNNADLFWACRGAGSGNFGVITSLTFKLPKKVLNATLINLDCNKISEEEMINLVCKYQEVFKTLDNRANFKLAIYNSTSKGIGIKITGVFYGDKKQGNALIQPLIDVVSNVNLELRYLSVLEVNRLIQDSHPDFEKYKSGGRFLYKNLDEKNIKDIISIIRNKPNSSEYTAITLYGLGGVVSNIKPEETAFFYRDANFIVGFQSVWLDDLSAEENKLWVENKYKEIMKFTTGAFINFPINCLDNYKKEYYGDNLEKLLLIKKKYDKNKFFNFEQGI